MQDVSQPDRPVPGSRWESLVWPQWLPIRARLPLIAQITAGTALLAALTMPAWTEVPTLEVIPTNVPANAAAHLSPSAIPQSIVVPHAPPVAPQPPPAPSRPAHLNLDVRHSFGNLALSVVVDDKRVVETQLEGSRKRFGAFGKRSEKGFTKTIDLEPGIRVVRVRVRSTEDHFDQTRVERFELGSASVASMRISADKTGLSIFADRPAPPPPAPVTVATTPVQVQVAPVPPPPISAGVGAPSAAAELYQALRSMLIAVTGFIASAATGFVVQEFLRSRKGVLGLD